MASWQVPRCQVLFFGCVLHRDGEETLRFEVRSSVFPLDRIHWDGCSCFLGSWAQQFVFFCYLQKVLDINHHEFELFGVVCSTVEFYRFVGWRKIGKFGITGALWNFVKLFAGAMYGVASTWSCKNLSAFWTVPSLEGRCHIQDKKSQTTTWDV